MTKHRILLITALTMFFSQCLSASAIEIRKKLGKACQKNNFKAMKWLLDKNKNDEEIRTLDEQGNSLLHDICITFSSRGEQGKGVTDIIKLLLEYNFSPNAKNNDGNTPFHYICNNIAQTKLTTLYTELIILFFEKGAQPDIQNETGDTPFHYICNDIAKKEFDIDLIKLFFEKGACPNIQNDEGDTPYHYVTNGAPRFHLAKLFIECGANENISNNKGLTSYDLGVRNSNGHKNDIRTIHERDWHYVKEDTLWQEYKNYLPSFIRKIFRYREPNVQNTNDLVENDPNVINMITVHDINDHENQGYYDPANSQFKHIMQFAEAYIARYNLKREEYNLRKAKEATNYTPKKLKTLHLTSFLWHSDLIASAEGLAGYLDAKYRNAELLFFAHGFGCDVVNLTSHRLGFLNEINEKFAQRNENIRELRKNKVYKGRIKLLMHFLPICRHKIPEAEKSLSIDLLGGEYDKLNDSIATTPTNYDLMLNFYSPNDKKIKENAFTRAMKHTAISSISSGALAGAITSQVVPGPLSAIIGGVTGTIYPGLTAYNKRKTISESVRHQYKKVTPINECKNNSFIIKGPKVHLKTMIDNNYIDHAIPAELLKNIPDIFKMLKTQYVSELARSRNFCININTSQDIQDELLKYLNEDDIAYEFNDDDIDLNIKKDFKFWDNKVDNCKIQCWLDKNQSEPTIINDRYFHWARMSRELREAEEAPDTEDLKAQTGRTAVSHKRLYGRYKEIVNSEQ